MTETAIAALQADNALLRENMATLQDMFTANTTKLGYVCGRLGISSDTPIEQLGPAVEQALRNMGKVGK